MNKFKGGMEKNEIKKAVFSEIILGLFIGVKAE